MEELINDLKMREREIAMFFNALLDLLYVNMQIVAFIFVIAAAISYLFKVKSGVYVSLAMIFSLLVWYVLNEYSFDINRSLSSIYIHTSKDLGISGYILLEISVLVILLCAYILALRTRKK